MDKIKAQLAVALKYGFWIGSVLVLISSLVVWYLSTSTLAQETDSKSSRLDGVIRKISSDNLRCTTRSMHGAGWIS